MITIDHVLNEFKKHHKGLNTENIQKAYDFAKKWHGDQKRETGEPFIIHPLNVAYTLAKMQLGESSIISALLHDIHEDTPVSLEEIQREFGVHIANIVDGVTKLGKVKLNNEVLQKSDMNYLNLQKMFMAMSKDVRVIIIKLADRLHNMETLQGLPKEHQQRKAHETLEIYAPIANRLGMGEMKGQLEDLAFMYIFPKEYEWLIKTFQKSYQERRGYIEKVRRQAKKFLSASKVEVVGIEGRAKHLYSLYRKLQRHDGDISKIYDLIAVRIIVKDIPTCYQALGIIHQHWKPLVGRIKDYIATPKPNGYKSLHTTVFAIESKIVEIQIRTKEMHKEAEYGIAAHWIYADSKQFKDYVKRIITKSPEDELQWIKELSKWQDAPSSEREKMIERLRIDYFSDRIFVFTPSGDVRDLPEGATVIDFAYTIHTQVGHHAKSATINQRSAKLFEKLKNGDIVNIITDKKQKGPKQEWLGYIKTDQARTEINKWLITQDTKEHKKQGYKCLNQNLQELLETSIDALTEKQKEEALKKLNIESFDKLLEEIGSGHRDIYEPIKQLFHRKELFARRHIILKKDEHKTKRKQSEGEDSSLVIRYASCCEAEPGKKVIIENAGNDPGIIHAIDCKTYKQQTNDLEGYWVKESKPRYATDLHISTKNRIGLLRDIAEALNANDVNIETISTSKSENRELKTNIYIEIDVWGLHHLKTIIEEIKKVDGVYSIERHRFQSTQTTKKSEKIQNQRKDATTKKTSSTK